MPGLVPGIHDLLEARRGWPGIGEQSDAVLRTAMPAITTESHEPRHERLQIRFPQRAVRARFHPPGLGTGRARRAGEILAHHRLYRLRLHRALAPCRLAAADHDAVLA